MRLDWREGGPDGQKLVWNFEKMRRDVKVKRKKF
jgi:hypothetical protein